MIVIDTSIWVDHLRRSDPALSELLARRRVFVHPFVVGELALGSLGPKADFLRFLQKFPEPVLARHLEVLSFIERHKLFGLGLGFIDTHLLASTQLTTGAQLWTRDKRLLLAATHLQLEYTPT